MPILLLERCERFCLRPYAKKQGNVIYQSVFIRWLSSDACLLRKGVSGKKQVHIRPRLPEIKVLSSNSIQVCPDKHQKFPLRILHGPRYSGIKTKFYLPQQVHKWLKMVRKSIPCALSTDWFRRRKAVFGHQNRLGAIINAQNMTSKREQCIRLTRVLIWYSQSALPGIEPPM